MRFLTTLFAGFLGTLAAFFFVFFLGFLLIVGLASSLESPTPTVPRDALLVLDLAGGLPEYAAEDPVAEAFFDAPSRDLSDLLRAIDRASGDDRIQGLVLRPVGLGANWAQLQEVREALLAFKASGKPLVAFADGEGFTETAYFLATAADMVYSPPEASFELNGFAIIPEFYKNTLDKLDVDVQIVRAGAFKSAGESFSRTDLSPENEQQLQQIVDRQHEAFIAAVAEGRGLTPEAVQALMRADAFYTAEEAFNAGLIDALMYEDEMHADLNQEREEDYDTIHLDDYIGADRGRRGAGTIAVVYAEGMILSGESAVSPLGGSSLGAETFIDAMETARDDDDVRAIVLRINSPGGSAAASDAMWHAVVQAQAAKPVIVSMGGVAASGGYYIAAPADTIVADPLTITGSIGVIYQLLDVGGFFNDKLGVTFDPVTTSPHADAFSGLRELTPAELNMLQTDVMATYSTFVNRVAEGRDLTDAYVREIGGGRVYTGADALDIGLVDVLGGLDTAIALAAERVDLDPYDVRLRVLPRPETLMETLLNSPGVSASRLWHRWMLTDAERTVLAQARLVQTLAGQDGMRMELPFRLQTR